MWIVDETLRLPGERHKDAVTYRSDFMGYTAFIRINPLNKWVYGSVWKGRKILYRVKVKTRKQAERRIASFIGRQ